MATFGTIANPETIGNPDNTVQQGFLFGKSGEALVAHARGDYYTPAYRGEMYSYTLNAITLPVNASGLVSKFTIYNPTTSNKNMELIRFDWGYALATTVVNTIGLYYTGLVATAASTFTTAGTAVACNLNNPAGALAVPYSAFTVQTGVTPTQICTMGYSGATTSAVSDVNAYEFKGGVLVPPGFAIHVAMTVAASTGSGFSGTMTWAEHLI